MCCQTNYILRLNNILHACIHSRKLVSFSSGAKQCLIVCIYIYIYQLYVKHTPTSFPNHQSSLKFGYIDMEKNIGIF